MLPKQSWRVNQDDTEFYGSEILLKWQVFIRRYKKAKILLIQSFTQSTIFYAKPSFIENRNYRKIGQCRFHSDINLFVKQNAHGGTVGELVG